MGFGLAGAMMGLGQGIQEWADAKQKEIADEKKRAQGLVDAKELAKYKSDLAAGRKGGGSAGASKIGLTSDEKKTIDAAFNESDWDAMGPEGKLAAYRYAEDMKREAAAAGTKLTSTDLATAVRSGASRGDAEKTEKGIPLWPFDNRTTLEKGAGEYTGKFGASAAVQANPPTSAIEALKQNPNLSDQFDAKYGKGASAQYLQ